jgi:hypothetical protein
VVFQVYIRFNLVCVCVCGVAASVFVGLVTIVGGFFVIVELLCCY